MPLLLWGWDLKVQFAITFDRDFGFPAHTTQRGRIRLQAGKVLADRSAKTPSYGLRRPTAT